MPLNFKFYLISDKTIRSSFIDLFPGPWCLQSPSSAAAGPGCAISVDPDVENKYDQHIVIMIGL